MKTGDRVKLIGIPADVTDGAEMETRTLFEKCLGATFLIAGVKAVAGLPYPLAEIDVGHILGEASYMHTVWVEEKYLEVESQRISRLAALSYS